MSIENNQKVVKVAPINFDPNEESALRDVLAPSGSQLNREYSYLFTNFQAARSAEILIAKLDTGDYDRTSRLLKRVYGVKSTIFICDSPDPQKINGYKYIVKGDELNSTLLKMLDRVSDAELRFEAVPKLSPSDSPPPVAQPEQQINASPGDYHGRVLIVDDSPSVRMQLNLYLNKRKFECYTAQDSQEAIRAVQQVQFDLIFLDVIMPGVDGYQACKVIKSLAGTKKTPVILLTSKNSPIDRIHGIMSGCDKYLTKPVKSSELEELLHSFFPKYVSKKTQEV
jgi:CheY-like chemotaxis protein